MPPPHAALTAEYASGCFRGMVTPVGNPPAAGASCTGGRSRGLTPTWEPLTAGAPGTDSHRGRPCRAGSRAQGDALRSCPSAPQMPPPATTALPCPEADGESRAGQARAGGLLRLTPRARTPELRPTPVRPPLPRLLLQPGQGCGSLQTQDRRGPGPPSASVGGALRGRGGHRPSHEVEHRGRGSRLLEVRVFWVAGHLFCRAGRTS